MSYNASSAKSGTWLAVLPGAAVAVIPLVTPPAEYGILFNRTPRPAFVGRAETNMPILDTIDRLSRETAQPDWDDEQGLAISRADWDRALELYRKTCGLGLPEPFPSPCGDGSVHLSWAVGPTKFVIEWRGSQIFWSFFRLGQNPLGGTAGSFDDAVAMLRMHLNA